MKAVRAIYNAPIIKNEFDGVNTSVVIRYNGRDYTGSSKCHEEDLDFSSKRVGFNIAKSRAIIQILEKEYIDIQKSAIDKFNFYREVIAYGAKSTAEVDPTASFFKNITHTYARAAVLKEALEKEKSSLDFYLKGHGKALSSIRRQRAKDNNS